MSKAANLIFQEAILRPVCDEIMTITEADSEQTYATLAQHVREWGNQQFVNGLVMGRRENGL